MKRIHKIIVAAATASLGLVLAIGSAQAQVTSTGTTSGAVNLTLQGTIQSSIVLDVNVANVTHFTGATTNAIGGATATATVDFGTFNTQSGFITPANGKFVRIAAESGAFLVAEMTATARYTGGLGGAAQGQANINVTGLAPTGFAAGMVTRIQKGAAITWAASTDGTAVNATDFPLCDNNSATLGDCASGQTFPHELAVWVPDTAPAGAFSQVVHYAASLD